MKKYQKLVKVTLGLAFVLGLGVASFNQPSLAVASSASYDVEAESIYRPAMVQAKCFLLSADLGSKEPIAPIVPQEDFDKLFDR